MRVELLHEEFRTIVGFKDTLAILGQTKLGNTIGTLTVYLYYGSLYN